jgi:hypothetical protein
LCVVLMRHTVLIVQSVYSQRLAGIAEALRAVHRREHVVVGRACGYIQR